MDTPNDWCKELNLAPWFNSEEVLHIFKLLDQNQNLKHVQITLQTWMDQILKIPNQVLATSQLVDVIVNNDTNAHYDDILVRKMYLHALIQFLNQCCPKHDQPIKKARYYNLNEWIVSICDNYKNKSEIPSMNVLKSAVRHSLSWLQVYYWKKQHNYLITYQKRSFCKLKILKTAFELYCKLTTLNYVRRNSIVNVKNIELEDSNLMTRLIYFQEFVLLAPTMTVKTALRLILKFIKTKTTTSLHELFINIATHILFKDGYFFIMLPEDRIEYLHNNNTEALPRGVVEAWNHFINLLVPLKLLMPFVTYLLDITNNAKHNDQLRKFASLWINHILQRILLTQLRLNVPMQIPAKSFFIMFPNLKNVSAFEPCFENDEIFKKIGWLICETLENVNIFNYNFVHCLLYVCKYELLHIKEIITNIETLLSPANVDNTQPVLVDAIRSSGAAMETDVNKSFVCDSHVSSCNLEEVQEDKEISNP